MAEKSGLKASTLRRPTLLVLGPVAWISIFSFHATHEPLNPNSAEVMATSTTTQTAAPVNARKAGRWPARHSVLVGSLRRDHQASKANHAMGTRKKNVAMAGKARISPP